jgi:TM2 domain-containing membrane protein YozV
MSALTIILFTIGIVLLVQFIAWIVNGVRINTYNNKIANRYNQAHKEK